MTVIFLIVVLVALVMVVHAIRRGTSLPTSQVPTGVLARVAKSLGGTQLEHEWYSPFQFPYRDTSVSVGYTGPGGNPGTYIVFEWPDKTIRCEIFPQAHRGGKPSLPGTWKVLINEPPFDADYYVSANSESRAANLLNAAVRERLHELFWLRTSPRLSRQSVCVLIVGGQLLISKPGQVASEEVLREFIELALGFYNEARLTCVEGIEFLGVKERAVSTQSLGDHTHCLVCGEPLAGQIVYCHSCQTPHHLDCWNYFGGCGTYGCGQKRFGARPLSLR